jgi:hypothetical protein
LAGGRGRESPVPALLLDDLQAQVALIEQIEQETLETGPLFHPKSME